MPSRSAVGIVIDAGVLQVVELTTDGGRLAVVRSLCEKLPSAAFTKGELTNPHAVADAVRQIFHSHRIPRRSVSLAFGGRLAIARVIEISETSAAEAEGVLQDRIARYAIYENQEVLWKAAPIEGEAAEKRVYLVASAAQAQVAALLPALRKTGIHVSRLEPYAMAMMRSLAACVGEDQRPVVLVALRSESTDFVIVRGKRPLLVRSVEQGLNDLTRQPQAMEDLLTEARRSLEFCRTRVADAKPRLWLSQSASENADAATAVLARLQESITDADVETVPTWPDAMTSAGARQAWAAVGTAMVDLPGHEAIPHLNLVPPDWPEIERVQKQLVQMIGSVGVAVLLTIGAAWGVRFVAGTTAKHAQAASVQMIANTSDVKKAGELKRQAAEALAQVNLWKEIRSEVRPFDWAGGIEKVVAQVPAGLRVQQATYRKGTIRLQGEAQSTDLIHAFVQRLSQLPGIEEASIERVIQTSNTKPGLHLMGYTVFCRLAELAKPEETPPPAPPQPAGGLKP